MKSLCVTNLVLKSNKRCWQYLSIVIDPVDQKVDNAIYWLNLYAVDNAIVFPNTYPLDSDLSDG